MTPKSSLFLCVTGTDLPRVLYLLLWYSIHDTPPTWGLLPHWVRETSPVSNCLLDGKLTLKLLTHPPIVSQFFPSIKGTDFVVYVSTRSVHLPRTTTPTVTRLLGLQVILMTPDLGLYGTYGLFLKPQKENTYCLSVPYCANLILTSTSLVSRHRYRPSSLSSWSSSRPPVFRNFWDLLKSSRKKTQGRALQGGGIVKEKTTGQPRTRTVKTPQGEAGGVKKH